MQSQTQAQAAGQLESTDQARPSRLHRIAAAVADYEGPRTARGTPTVEGLRKALGAEFAELTAAERDQAIDLSIAEADAIPPETQGAPESRQSALYALSARDEAAIAEQRRQAGVFVSPGEFAAGVRYPAKIVSEGTDGGPATLRVSLDGREGVGTIEVEAPQGEGPGTWSPTG